MLAICLASVSLRSPQVLRLRDATTKQEIALVGTVHYNPASVARAKEEVNLALDRYNKKAGALVVEACTSRWTRSLELAPPGSIPAKFIQSEMQGAAGVALQNDVPVLLGDADAGPFLERVQQLARQSARELLDPLRGWGNIYCDFARTLPGTLNPADVARSELLLEGERPLSLLDFARPEVFVGFLASLIRYPAAFALKAPVPFALFASGVIALDTTANELDNLASSAVASGEIISAPIVGSLAFSAFTLGLSVLTARLLLVAFLEERNAELARSIRRAAEEKNAPVVAILGGLHVNGVARLLMSEATPDADSPRVADGVWWEVPAGLDPTAWVE
jgi:hypothetical protein